MFSPLFKVLRALYPSKSGYKTQQLVNPVLLKVPPELWIRITSYLKEDELWLLRGVNRTFFELANIAQYRCLSVRSQLQVPRDLKQKMRSISRDPTLARIVTSVDITTDAENGDIHVWGNPNQYRCGNWRPPVQSITTRQRKAERSFAKALRRDLSRAMQALNNVTSLNVQFEPIYFPKSYMDVVWSKFSATIVRLVITTGGNGLPHIASLDPSLRCPNLLALEFGFDSHSGRFYSLPDEEEYYEALRRISLLIPSSIEELVLRLLADDPRVPFLHTDKHYPHLTRFTFSDYGRSWSSVERSNYSAALYFVDCHRQSLKSLTLRADAYLTDQDIPPSLYIAYALRAQLPTGLKELTVNVPFFGVKGHTKDPSRFHWLLGQLELRVTALERVKIEGYLSEEQVGQLFPALMSSKQLRHISIAVCGLTSCFLDMVMKYPPHFKVLQIFQVLFEKPYSTEMLQPFVSDKRVSIPSGQSLQLPIWTWLRSVDPSNYLVQMGRSDDAPVDMRYYSSDGVAIGAWGNVLLISPGQQLI